MRTVTRWCAFALLSGGLVFGQTAGASGFALAEQNASALGNAYAGVAATAEDASTVFFNPAGMTHLSAPSAALSLTAVNINSRFENRASQPALGQSLGGDGGNAGGTSVVPAAYFAMPLGSAALGIGVNAPFGLKTEYDADWMGRFQALKSEVKTLNLNPSFAVKLGDAFSVGIGANYQRLQAELTSSVNYTAVVAQGLQAAAAAGQIPALTVPGVLAANAGLQGITSIRGDDGTWGFNAGLIFQPTPRTALGLSYRSAMKYTIEGAASFTTPTAGNATGAGIIAQARATTLADGPVLLRIELPASARISLSQKIADTVELLGDVQWTQWSSVAELRVTRTNGATLQLTPENWQNSWRYSAGANFAVSDALKLRAGVALDRTPVPDATRTPRLPDEDRKWVTIGAQWRLGQNMSLDAAYAHLFARDGVLNQDGGNANAYGVLNGEQQSKIDLLGVQLSVSF